MRIRNVLSLLVFLFCIFGGVQSDLSYAAGSERILDFKSAISIQRDGSMTVSEDITVVCERKQIKRGIFRDFPTRYRDGRGNPVQVAFEVLEILRDGRPEPYHIKDLSNGKRVYIGQKNILLKPGTYTYRITYRTSRQLGFFKDFDELYWNVTGNGWRFTIDRAEAVVSLPPGTQILEKAAYTGAQGSKGKDYTVEVIKPGVVAFATTRTLRPGEGLTIAVSWPKGVVPEPTALDRIGYLLKDNRSAAWGIIGLLVLLVFYLTAWVRVGKDPLKGTIIPLFSPPENISPALARLIMRLGLRDDKIFAVAIVNMAVKGYLNISQDEDQAWTLEKTGADGKVLSSGEAKIAEKLFSVGSRVKLKKTNHERIGKAKKELTRCLMREARNKYFVLNSGYFVSGLVITGLILLSIVMGSSQTEAVLFMGVWLTIWSTGCLFLGIRVVSAWRHVGKNHGKRIFSSAGAIGITLFSIPFFVGEAVGLWLFTSASSLLAGVILLLVGLTNALFYHLLKAPTLKGRKLMDRIEGFKRYLSVAEKDRLNILNPPLKTPELFERYLPYALALDVEQQWGEQFAHVLGDASREEGGYRPAWYTGGAWRPGSPTGFVSSLGSSLSGAISSASTSPGSSSGSGGGGSSGGGGGGGGGGGW